MEDLNCTRCFSLEEDGGIGFFGVFVMPAIFRVIALLGFFWLHPLAVLIMNQVADYTDIGVQQWCSVDTMAREMLYNTYDKVSDATLYVVALAYLIRWRKELWYADWIWPWIAYRLIGNFVFLLTGADSRAILVVFANVGEILFIIYAFLDLIRVDRRIKNNVGANVGITVGTAIFKVGLEISMHIIAPSKAEFTAGACFTSVVRLFAYNYQMPLYAVLIAYLFATFRWPHFVEGTVERDGAGAFVPVRKRKQSAKPSSKSVEKAAASPVDSQGKYNV